jgi:putative ABC transport system permease protein
MSGNSRGGSRPRTADLWGLAFSAMRQQKVRTVLTLIGVVVGTLALALSLAIGRGVDRAIVNLFHKDDRLRKIEVLPNYHMTPEDMPPERREPKGTMSDAKRARMRRALINTWGGFHGRHVRLTPDGIRKLQSMKHVTSVVPNVRLSGKATLDGKTEGVSASSIAPGTRFFRSRLIAGRLFTPADGRVAIVHEYLLYRWGLVSDADAESALGRTFRMEIRSRPPDTTDLTSILGLGRGPREISEGETRALEAALKRLAALTPILPMPANERGVLRELFEHISATSTKKPSKTFTEEFTIVGVLCELEEKDQQRGVFDWGVQSDDILLPTSAADAFAMQLPETAEEGYNTVVVTADSEETLKELARQIERIGYRQFSLAEFIDVIRMNVLAVSVATAFVAFVALVVAAIGITNTMIMSVLERTHEIGVLKALGARDGHIRLIFVVEGMLLGLVGSGLGMALSLLASIPADSIARSIMKPQTHPYIREALDESLLAFPVWLVLGVPALVCLISTLAAWYPAARASRVDPVTSLRHE